LPNSRCAQQTHERERSGGVQGKKMSAAGTGKKKKTGGKEKLLVRHAFA
jgi:hypothetical protein